MVDSLMLAVDYLSVSVYVYKFTSNFIALILLGSLLSFIEDFMVILIYFFVFKSRGVIHSLS